MIKKYHDQGNSKKESVQFEAYGFRGLESGMTVQGTVTGRAESLHLDREVGNTESGAWNGLSL